MMFVKKPLAAGATLGDRLKALRTESGVTIETLGHSLSINPKYLTAIEESRYRDLPGLVYARQFVRKYAAALSTDTDHVMKIFEQEYAIVAHARPSIRPLLTQRVQTDFPWLRRHLRFIIAAIAVAIMATYIGSQAVKNFLPPILEVNEPSTDLSTTSTTIVVAGITDLNATVTINDQDVQTAGNGTFHESIDLHTGLNTLKISAIKKHSSARIVTRKILVETLPQ